MTSNDADKAQEAAPGASRAQRTSEPSLDTVAIRGREPELIRALRSVTDRLPGDTALTLLNLQAAPNHEVLLWFTADELLSALSQAQARVSLLEGVLGELKPACCLGITNLNGTGEPCPGTFQPDELCCRVRAALSEATLDGVGKDEEACSPSALDAPVSAPSGGSASPLEDQ